MCHIFSLSHYHNGHLLQRLSTLHSVFFSCVPYFLVVLRSSWSTSSTAVHFASCFVFICMIFSHCHTIIIVDFFNGFPLCIRFCFHVYHDFSLPHYRNGLFSSKAALFAFGFDFITKTRLYNFDPLKPHFYIVKLGLTGVYIIFLILLRNIDCGYSLEPPRRGGSNEYPQSMF